MSGADSPKRLYDRLRHHGGKLFFPAVIFLLPALMFHFMLPFTGTIITPSRAFTRYYLWHQMEHMISIWFGSFPIYLPFVSGGDFCSLSAGLGQLYLPLPYLASILPGYWTGYALDWVLLLNLLTIAVAHLSLFLFLKRLRFSPLLALTLSMVTVYSPRALLCLCYGSAGAAWTGHIFLCALLGLYLLKPTPIKGPLLIIIGGYWLINSGHPEEAYYCMLGTWLFAFLLPFVVETVRSDRPQPWREKIRFWNFWMVCCGLAFLLSAAYVVPFYREVVRHMDFANMTYAQSAPTLDTLQGLIYNFFLPVKTGLFGCFGGTVLYLLVLLIPLTRACRIRIGRGTWLAFLFIVLTFLYMAGKDTPVFSLFWHLLPFSSATRNPARASLMMPILFLPGMIWLFVTDKAIPLGLFGNRKHLPVRSVLAGAGIPVLFIGLAILAAMPPRLSPHARLNTLFIPAWVVPLLIAVASLTLLAVALHGLASRRRTVVEILLCGLVCVYLALLMRYGSTPLTEKMGKDTLTYRQLVAQKQRTLKLIPDYLFLFERAASHAELEQFNNYFVEPHLGQIFRKYIRAENRQDAYRILNEERRRDQVVLQGYPVDQEKTGASPGCRGKADRVRLTYSSYNRLVFETRACQPGFFMLSYPDPYHHWHAWVNGRKAPIYPANGISQAVCIPAGTAHVEFRYWSGAAFWGTLISCLTLGLIGVLIAFRSFSSQRRTGIIAAAVIIFFAAGLFAVWFHSLYTGRNFNTAYTWQSPTPKELSNLAFGKPAEISARDGEHSAYLHPRRGVDGDRSFDSCFVTAYQHAPWFKIDLKKVSTVDSLVITTSLQGYEKDRMVLYFEENAAATAIDGIFVFTKVPVLFNNLPLTIAVSQDGEDWAFAVVDRITPDVPKTVRFEKPVDIRYIKLIASGECRLCLNEVEVYPPEQPPAAGARTPTPY